MRLFQLQQNWGAPGKLCPFLQSAGPKGETEESGGGQPKQVCQSLKSRGENKWEKGKLIKTPTSPWQKARGPRLPGATVHRGTGALSSKILPLIESKA